MHYVRDRAAPVLVLTFQLVRHRVSFVVLLCVAAELRCELSRLLMPPPDTSLFKGTLELQTPAATPGFMEVWDSNSGLHTCTAHASPTEPSPQPNTGCSELTFALCRWKFTKNVSYRVAI